ncbi:MupA/Atu3671 family FMN-dependent luciferase-like monooxygenase [Actinokineospora sp. NPDC004072]
MLTTTCYTGPDLDLTDDDPRSLAEALLRAAETAAGVVIVPEHGPAATLPYAQLLDRARRVLGGLRARGIDHGDDVVLAGLPAAGFFPALWACLLGGIRPAVIAERPDPGSPAAARLHHTWRLLDEPLVLTGAPADAAAVTSPAHVTTVDECAGHPPAERLVEPDQDDVVLLMLSSGSTGAPKAAELTQRALVQFAASTRRLLDVRPEDVTANWLPLDHSGALLLYHVLAVFVGCTNVHAPTEAVLAEPTRWLDLLAEHRATHSWGPTFAYRMAADAAGGRSWDLSSVRSLLCGGEQVSLPVLRRFLAATGLPDEVIVPAWGMAETTTAISFGRLSAPGTVLRLRKSDLADADESTPDHERVTYVAVGPPAHEASVRAVDDEGATLPENRVGRLQIRSIRTTPGYRGAPAPYTDDGWLETGDLAFLRGGQIVITGRHKDVIIINGHNHFAHEIEEVAASVPGLRAGDVAACGIPDADAGTESLAVWYASDDPGLAGAIRAVLHRRLRLTPAHVIAVPDLPRTPAGKLQRSVLRDRLVAELSQPVSLGRVVAECVASVAGRALGPTEPFYEAGVSSVGLVQVRQRLSRALEREVPQTALFEYPTIAGLTEYLAGGVESRPAAVGGEPATVDNRIAIIGMALRFPGADTVEGFWANLRAGVDSTRTFTPREAAAAGVPEALLAERDRRLTIGALADVDAFDAEFFGLTPREAALVHPAQRLFLECCYHALEDGGYATATDVGVFAGSGMTLYGHQLPTGPVRQEDGVYAAMGGQADFLATRVAYRIGLTGPAIGVQTACSTSLVAVHLAVQALLAGEVELALAGAAAVFAPQEAGYRAQPDFILSPTGRCRPFAAAADGTVGGNGVAAVLLKRLDRAIADGDTVHAVILGSAVNNDGAGKAGFTAPGVAGQVEVVRSAVRKAGIPAETISYVEAHGTGTALGDPVEFEALSRALGGDRTSRCGLGSVKGNIGHLDSCAGMAGLIKTVLMLRHRELVPTLHLDRPHPDLRLSDSPFELCTTTRPWPTNSTPRRAGVSALGVGGTNAHVVLEEAPPQPQPKPASPATAPRSAHARLETAPPRPERGGPAAVHTPHAGLNTAPPQPEPAGQATVPRSAHARLEMAPPRPEHGRQAAEPTSAHASHAGLETAPRQPERGGPAAVPPAADGGPEEDRPGHGGAVVVPPAADGRPEEDRPGHGGAVVVPLSARSPEGLAAVVGQLREHLVRHPDLRPVDVAASMAARRHHAHRVAVVGVDSGGLVAALGRTGVPAPLGGLVLAFPGQGEARFGMARALYARFPVFRGALDECEAVCPGLVRLLVDSEHRSGAVWPTETAQPALFAFQVALARLWESFGVVPDMVTGYSLGEYAALCAAGALSVADGLRLCAARGRMMARCAPGGMLAVRASLDLAERVAVASGAEVVAIGPGSTVLGGSAAAIGDAAARLDAEGVRWRRLDVDRAFHSTLLDPILPELGAVAAAVPIQPTRIAVVSSMDGRVCPPGWRPDADHLVSQARNPVRFDAVLTAIADRTALEVGPGNALSGMAMSERWIPALAGPEPVEGVLRAVAELYARGVDLDWARVNGEGRRVPLPGYPFARTRFPIPPPALPAAPAPPPSAPPSDPPAAPLSDPTSEPVTAAPTAPALTTPALTTPALVGSASAGGPLDAVVGVVGQVLGLADVRPDQTFLGMGADSLALLNLNRELERALGVRVPVRSLFDKADTPRKLAALIAPPPQPEPVAPVTGDTKDLVARQLSIAERLVDLMERQLALLSTDEQPAAPTRPLTQVQQAPTTPTRSAHPTPPPGEPAACDFSLYFFGDYPDQTGGDKYGLITAATEFADEHGFHAVWLPERHFHSFGALFPNPSVLAAALAARTRRIRLHAGSVVLPLHNPIRVAEEWAVVDNLSGGRVGLCVASGWHATDFALAPENFGKHRDLVFDQLDTVRKLWAGEAVPATAGDGSQVELRSYPRPVQQQPPLYLAVVGNPESYRRAGAEGLGVVTNLMAQTPEQLAENIARYRRARAEHGLDPAGGRVVVLLHTYLREDADQARDEAFRPFCDYLRSSLSLFNQVTNSLGLDVDLDSTPADDVDFLLAQAYRRYCADRALIGDRATAAAVVDRLVGAGVDEIACFVDFGVAGDRVLAALPEVDLLRERYRARPAPLSPAQRRIWFLERMYPGTSTYHEPKAIRLDGPLDADALIGALRRAVNRHPALRTVFREVDGEPRRVVLPAVDVDCPVLDFSGTPEDEALRAVLAADGKQLFDLADGPLLLARLIRLADDRHLLFLLVHHIVFDSSSTAVLVRDIAAHYRAWPQPPDLAPLPPEPQTEPDPSRVAADLEFWRRELAGATPSRLATDRPRPAVRSGSGASLTREFGPDLLRELREFGVERRGTVFMAMVGAITAVLGRFGGQDDVVVGTAVANRPPGAEDRVGLFLDTLPLRVDLSGDPTFTDLVRRVFERATTALEHRDAPFDDLVAAVNPDRDAGSNPLFQVMVEFEREKDVEFASLVAARLLDVPSDRAPFDLTVYLTQHRDGVRCMVEYDTDLFDRSTVARMVDYVETVLRRALDDPETRLSALTAPTADDRAVIGSCAVPADPAPGLCLHELVEAQAERTPEAVALLGDEVEVTYRELVARAAAVAAWLHGRGVGRGDRVAILLPRGVDLIATVLGVLRSGAAYVPLDPAWPTARVAFCVQDCGAALLLATDATLSVHSGLDGVPVDRIPQSVAMPDIPRPGPDDPAYCIYTSGSTGRPKGVLVPHRGPVNLVRWHLRAHPPLRTAQWTSLAFDVSVQEVFTTLAAGAALVLVDAGGRHDIAGVVARHGVQRLFLPFTPLKHLAETAADLPSLREVFAAGEAMVLTPALRRFLAAHPRCVLHNQYGPTETSIIVTSHRVDPAGPDRPPIGRPIPGVRLRITDADGRDVPVGVPGEIQVGGTAVAIGYLGVDSAAFAEDPDQPGALVYRTGDLGRLRADGTVEFLGRADDQVKIRGHRVEPGEVTAALTALDGVADAAVLARPDHRGEQELVAYAVAPAGTDDLAARLAETLPDHLIPRRWVLVDRLPYGPNGKLDRDRLPTPGTEPADAGTGPRTPAEHAVHAIWCAELGLASAPVTQSFFASGGHSLTAVRLLNRIAREHGVEISLTRFFQAPTIRALAAALPAAVVDRAPMPSTLRRLWHKHHGFADPSVYNVVQRADIDGPLDVDALGRALAEVVRRHPALRSRCADHDGELTVEVLADLPMHLSVSDVDPAEADDWCRAQAAAPFALTEAPLFRFRVARLGGDRWIVLAVLHHAVCDAWSLGVLWRELAACYAAGGAAGLPEPGDFAEFARAERNRLTGAGRAELDRFWRAELAGLPAAALPTDRPRPERLSGRGGLHEWTIGADVAERVRRVAADADATPYAVLAAAFAAWLSRVCGTPDLVVPTSSANRLRPGDDGVFGIVGGAVLLRARVADAPDFAGLVAQVGGALWRALDHQDLPLGEVVGLLDAPPPAVLLTVVTTPAPEFPLPGASTAVRAVPRAGLARTELYVVLTPADDGIGAALEYSTDLFDAATAERWAGEFTALLTERTAPAAGNDAP